MRRVILESPYAGDVEANVAYARACLRDCLERDEAPIASHLLYTQPGVLRDDVPAEREWGIEAGLAWASAAEHRVFYVDRGWSPGMLAARLRYEDAGLSFEERTLPGYTEASQPDWIVFTRVGDPFEQRMTTRNGVTWYQHRPLDSDGEWLEGRPGD